MSNFALEFSKGIPLDYINNLITHNYSTDTKLCRYNVQISISETFFHGGKAQIIFLYAEEPPRMKMCTGHKICHVGAFLSPAARHLCNNTKRLRQNKTKYNLQYDPTKTKQSGSWQHTEITPVLPIARQNFPRYITGFMEFFAVFKSLYLFQCMICSGTTNDIPWNLLW